jgi:hypothetical protein
MITLTTEPSKNRDDMTIDISNAFAHTDMENKQERIMMKIMGPLADMFIEIELEVYEIYVNEEDNKKVF